MSGTPYDPLVDVVDPFSAAVFARFRAWAQTLDGTWARWDPGYLVLTIATDGRRTVDEVLVDSCDGEVTVAYGGWHDHVLALTAETTDEEYLDHAFDEVLRQLDRWFSGAFRVAHYADAAGRWCGSIPVTTSPPAAIVEGARWYPTALRADLRSPRLEDRRWFQRQGGSWVEDVG